MMLIPFVVCAFLNAPELSSHPTKKYITLSKDFHVFTTDTQAQSAVPASKESIAIGDFKFRVVKVVFDETAMGFVPVNMNAGNQVMFVEFELLTNNKDAFKGLEISVSNNSGQKSKAFILTSDGIIQMLSSVTVKGTSSNYQPGEDNITWAFVVPKGADKLYLNFPTGEVVDLTPFILVL
jgi:hypothetical protein